MEDLSNTVIGVLQSMGKPQLALILGVATIILIWLIVREVRVGSAKTKAAEAAKPSFRETLAESQKSATSSAGTVEQVVSPQSKPVDSPVTAEIKPETLTAAVKSSVVEPTQSAEQHLPDDSVQHRHYEATLQAQKLAITNPYPTDSILRRHYDTLHKLVVDTPAPIASGVQAPLTENPTAKGISSIEQAVNRSSKVTTIEAAFEARQTAAAKPLDRGVQKPSIPEDSTLRRHFIHELQAEIEARLTEKPSDSILRRHYESLIQCELEKRLAGFG